LKTNETERREQEKEEEEEINDEAKTKERYMKRN